MIAKQVKRLELTFAMFKPHIAVVPWIVKGIRSDILKNGFYVIRTKRSSLDVTQARKFYDEHREKFFFHRLVTFICSGPCYFHVLARDNAIQEWRTMMGPTRVYEAIYTHPNTIRGTYGLSNTRNATHGSDSPRSAEKEIQFFFPEFIVSDWYGNEETKYLRGEYEFDKEEFVHVTR